MKASQTSQVHLPAGDAAVVGLLLVSFVAYFWDFLLRQFQWAIQETDD